MRKILTLTLLFISFACFSQEAMTKKSDSITYNLYNTKQWKQLKSYAEKNNFDYYFYNVRIGIAYFYENEYYQAEQYLKKAIKQYENDFAKTYLFWTYFNLGETALAEQVYDQLSEEAKSEIDYSKKTIESIYLEFGLKNPKTNEADNTYYGNLVLKHRLGKKIHVLHSLNTFSQNQSNQDYNSFQYHLVGSYYTKTKAISLGGIFTNSEFNLASNQLVEDDLGNVVVNYTSNNKSKVAGFYVNYNQRFNRLRINLNFNILNQNTTLKDNTQVYLETDNSLLSNEDTNTKATQTVFIPSAGFLYTPKFTKDRVTLGADLFVAIGEQETNTILKPYLNFFISNKFWVNTNYIEVPEQLFADFSSEILYNTPNLKVKRLVTTANYAFSTKVITKLTYTFENYDFSSIASNYNINSIFLGVQYKF